MAEIVINQAKPGDAKRIGRLLEQWLATSAIPWPQADRALMREWVGQIIDQGYVVLAECSADQRLYGVAGVQPCFMPWNVERPMMRDAFFYVPRSRARGDMTGERAMRVERAAERAPAVANALLDAIKLYCARRNLPLLMEIVTGIETDKLERWFGIKGGRYAGGTMVFGLEG